jgi:hypothetical protein
VIEFKTIDYTDAEGATQVLHVASLAVSGRYQPEIVDVIVRKLNGTQPGELVTIQADVAVRQPKEPGQRARLSVSTEEL